MDECDGTRARNPWQCDYMQSKIYSRRVRDFIRVKEIDDDLFREFRSRHDHVLIAGRTYSFGERAIDIPPPTESIPLETSTIWSFPKRGSWATHSGDYRGNWPPQIPRNLILRYTHPGEMVLDQMMGCGTTLIECRLLGRDSIGVDVSLSAVMLAKSRIDFGVRGIQPVFPRTRTYVGDARNLSLLADCSVHLVATHPPYANIIDYSSGLIENDISSIGDLDGYFGAMRKVAQESYRVLKPGRYCAILIGDTRRRKHYVPLSVRVMEEFLEAGFVLKEDIIKIQWKVESSRITRKEAFPDFYKIAHEHLFVFRKVEYEGELELLQASTSRDSDFFAKNPPSKVGTA